MGLDNKTDRLTDCQSQCDFDFGVRVKHEASVILGMKCCTELDKANASCLVNRLTTVVIETVQDRVIG
jgi:hypothetical protein